MNRYALLVLVCPFTSIGSVVSDKIGTWASYLLSDRFDNLARLSQVHGPLLLIHGQEDSIIPCDHSKSLYKRAKSRDIVTHIKILEGCDHNTMDLKRIANDLRQFFQYQFDSARKKDRKTRYGSFIEAMKSKENGSSKKKKKPSESDEDDDESDEESIEIKPPSKSSNGRLKKTQRTRAKKNKRKKSKISGMTVNELFPNAPNLDLIDMISIKVPAYCWLKPRPKESIVPESSKESKEILEMRREKDRELQRELDRAERNAAKNDLENKSNTHKIKRMMIEAQNERLIRKQRLIEENERLRMQEEADLLRAKELSLREMFLKDGGMSIPDEDDDEDGENGSQGSEEEDDDGGSTDGTREEPSDEDGASLDDRDESPALNISGNQYFHEMVRSGDVDDEEDGLILDGRGGNSSASPFNSDVNE